MVAQFGFGAGGEEGLRQLLAFFQPFGHLDAADGAVFLVGFPAAAGDVAPDDAFHRDHVQFPAFHALAGEFRSPEEFGHIRRIHTDHVVGDDVFGIVEPEFGHLGQDGPFVRNGVFRMWSNAEIRSEATMIRLSPRS